MDQFSNMTISYIFIGAGIVLIGAGMFAYFRQKARNKRFNKAVGTVIELLPLRSEGEYLVERTAEGVKIKRKYLYRPVIRFKTQTGRQVKFSPSIASRPQPFQAGDQVQVIYDPHQPQQAQINRFLNLWFWVLILFFFGLFMLAMGGIGILLAG